MGYSGAHTVHHQTDCFGENKKTKLVFNCNFVKVNIKKIVNWANISIEQLLFSWGCHLEAHVGFFRLLMKGILGRYIL